MHTRRSLVHQLASATLGVGLLPSIGRAAGEGASPLSQIPTAKNVIYLYMSGGMSHLDTFDPKSPGSEVMGSTGRVASSVDDLFVSDNVPQLASQMHHFSVIRSMNSTQGAHEQGNYFMHTSYGLRGTIRHPSMGAWLGKFQDKDNPTLPGSVVIGGNSRHPGAGFFESKFAPLMIGDPESGLKNAKRPKGIPESRFQKRIDMARTLDAPFHDAFSSKNTRAYADLYDEAMKLMRSEDLAAFDLSREPDELRERYGSNSFGQGCVLARRLIEHNVRFVEVGLGRWDTHTENFTNVPTQAQILDRALASLVQDLEARGLLDETLIVLATEFGRTPKINVNAGRDHYPKAFTCLLAGGGVRGGYVHGSTDERGAEVNEKKVSVPDLNATIGYALGLPLNHVLYSPSKRPFTVADKGKPVTELFG